MKKLISVAVSALLCSSIGFASPQEIDNLTSEFAQTRREQIKSVRYELGFTLTQGSPTFEGRTKIFVELNRKDLPVNLDLHAKEIKKVTVNGYPVSDLVIREGNFDIPKNHFQRRRDQTSFEITVEYTGEFTSTGSGFGRFVDPADGLEYTHTNSEPYDAHHIFPCFDQPDIKGSFKVLVTAPKDWKVISNEKPNAKLVGPDFQKVGFRETQPISTYLLFLGAGPYEQWNSQFGNTPLAIYARQSLKEYVDAPAIFEVTKKGLGFYNQYFDYAYPFSKYDHVFVPEFGAGAMENPGAVTMNERMIFRGSEPRSSHLDREIVILHEMAHMWFGDLVTMKWWNDLWLNESFATFMSFLSHSEIYKREESWQSFFSEKTWGYWQDQLVTTHPIEANVVDTNTAGSNFDGITYAKGASTLKQLWYQVGPEHFQTGVQNYFKKYAWKNAERKDFIGEISAASNMKLDTWTSSWLQTAGPHTIRAEWACRDGVVGFMRLIQSPNQSGVLSPHKTKVGLYRTDESGQLVLTEQAEVSYATAEHSVDELVGKPCPEVVYPNVDDMDYGLFFLDSVSIANIQKNLSAIESATTRTLIWGSLYQMVRFQEFKATDLITLLTTQLPHEKDEGALAYLFGDDLRVVYESYLTPEERATFAPRLSEIAWNELFSSRPSSTTQLQWFDYYLQTLNAPEQQQVLHDFLSKAIITPGLEIDQERRWDVISQLARLGSPDALRMIEIEARNDRSLKGQENALAAKSSFPDLAIKQEQWHLITENADLSHTLRNAAARPFHSPNHPELSMPFVNAFFAKVKSLDWNQYAHWTRPFFRSLYPKVCDQAVLDQSKAELETATVPSYVQRAWLEAQDELARCISVRKASH